MLFKNLLYLCCMTIIPLAIYSAVPKYTIDDLFMKWVEYSITNVDGSVSNGMIQVILNQSRSLEKNGREIHRSVKHHLGYYKKEKESLSLIGEGFIVIKKSLSLDGILLIDRYRHVGQRFITEELDDARFVDDHRHVGQIFSTEELDSCKELDVYRTSLSDDSAREVIQDIKSHESRVVVAMRERIRK